VDKKNVELNVESHRENGASLYSVHCKNENSSPSTMVINIILILILRFLSIIK